MKNKEHAKELIKNKFKDKEIKTTKHYSKKFSAVILAAFSVLSCVLAALGFVFLKSNLSDTDALKAFVEKNYFLSMLSVIVISMFQVIIALIPGELVEIASGYAFGAVPGAIYSLIGVTIGSIIVILLSRKFGRALVEAFFPREKIDSLPILRDPNKRNFMTGLLFFLPGTPKDLMTYVVGITDMSIPTYLALTTVARLPSIIISTIGGSALGDNRFVHAIIAFIISGIVSLAGYLIYSKISKSHKAKKEKENAAKSESSGTVSASDNGNDSYSNQNISENIAENKSKKSKK